MSVKVGGVVKLRAVLPLLLVLVAPLAAMSHERTATVVRMELVRCSGAEPQGFGAMLSGSTDPSVCREYLLRTDKVVYLIRSRRDMLLPVGEEVHFRLARKEMLVRVDDDMEMKFFVSAMIMAGEEPARAPSRRMCLNVVGETIACGE